ncbi:MAG TPA: guanylate kinase [Streptosporangiaceae bacterium]|jgi:guanylate kinase|nr:guanylate kinase [Streptosporangiaceae bacterium]
MLAAEPRGLRRGAPAPARLTVLSGPSAVGKSTVAARLRSQCPWIWQSVSVTTRPPRPGEMNGREYFFVSEREFEAMAGRGELLESAQFAGNRYGTPRAPVQQRLDQGMPALLELDVAGARQVRAAVPGSLLIFMAPPSWEELERRLIGRNTESPEAMSRRLEAARIEMAASDEFDITLVNTSVEDVCDQLVALMQAQYGNAGPDLAERGIC